MATIQSIISDIVTLTPMDQADLKRWFIHSFFFLWNRKVLIRMQQR